MVGKHPDGIAVVDQHQAAVDVPFAENRSKVLGARDALRAIQQTHSQMLKAQHDYQQLRSDGRGLVWTRS